MESKLLVSGNELLQANNVPVLIKNKVLISPGTWNDITYTAKELEKAYLNTDWSDKSNISLYLDHKDTQNEGAANWVGYVKNVRMQDKGVIVGDLEIWNPLVALYLKNAKAKFGISATLRGIEDKEKNQLKNFRFESFSIVTEPACKESYINLSQKKLKGGLKMAEKETKVVLQEQDELQEEESSEQESEEAVETAEEEAEENVTGEESAEEAASEEETQELKAKKKKKYP